MANKILKYVALLSFLGCGDFATNSDLEKSNETHEQEIAELETRIDSLNISQNATHARVSLLETDVDALEAVFISDVILNTQIFEQSGGSWEAFGGKINLDTKWRFLEENNGEITGGFTSTWTNNTSSDITVYVSRLAFEDVNGIQIAEYNYFGSDEFPLDAGQTRERTDNFSFFSSVASANKIFYMGTWASFTEQ